MCIEKEHNDCLFGTAWLKSPSPAKPSITSLENCNCVAAVSETPANGSFYSDNAATEQTDGGIEARRTSPFRRDSQKLRIGPPFPRRLLWSVCSESVEASVRRHRWVFCHLSSDGTLMRCWMEVGGWGHLFMCLGGGGCLNGVFERMQK